MEVIDHATAALARLAQYLRDKPNVTALLGDLNGLSQDAEVMLQGLLTERSLDTAVGVYLDKLGEIVGQVRGPLTDEPYRDALRARIKINASSGTVPEILEVFEILVPLIDKRLRDEPPAAFTLEFTQALTADQASVFISILRTMKAGGVRALLEYGLATPAVTFTLDGTSAQALDTGLFRGTLI